MDPYFKKQITYKHNGHEFLFDIGHTLFSSFDVDQGTDIFLRFLAPSQPRTILDLGCGYGPIGIILARQYPDAQVIMADKDLLAVRYAQYNITHNAITNATVVGSVGLENVPDLPYDLIVSNIPAKVGDLAIEHEFLLAPYERLQPSGDYWFVIVSGLNHLIPRLGQRHQLRLKEVKKRAGHSVYHLHKPATNERES
jgi:16S rRNA (guanine1207-N2)-methyltransferase